jgi:hypothetical protein
MELRGQAIFASALRRLDEAVLFETGEDVVGIGSPCHVPPGMNNLPHLHSSPLTSSSLCYISIHRLGQA